MRNGSAAIVPLVIGVMLLFWYIAFMGGASDELHAVNSVTNLQRLQDKLLISSVKYRYTRKAEANVSEGTLDTEVDEYVDFMMCQNGIQDCP